MKRKTRILSLMLCVALMLPFLQVPVYATNINDTGVFVKQETNYTCTLASAVMMLRRCAILNGDSNWKSITESNLRYNPPSGTIWIENGGLKQNFTYNSMKVTVPNMSSYNTAAKKKDYFISMLNAHPEGIIIYKQNVHAVLLTDYDSSTGTFYCADPAKSASRIKLEQCTISGSGQNGKLNSINQIWYIKENSTSVTNSQTTSNGKSTLAFKSMDAPSSVKQGSYYSLRGTVNSNYNITSIKAEILSSSGKAVCTASVSPNAKSFSILNSKLDTGMTFNTLAAGSYTLKYTAKDASGATKNWTKAFKIGDAVQEASTLAFKSMNAPSSLKQGSYYSLKGTVSSNYNITSIKAELLNSSGKAVCEVSVSPNAKSFSILNSKLDTGITFNTVSAGKYTLKYTAKDASGTTKTWTSGTITITAPASSAQKTSYDPDAALTYAKKHWNDGKGLCAEFVSDCLSAGGCDAWSVNCGSLLTALQKNGWGTLSKLNVASNGTIYVGDNPGKVGAGDLIFFYCNQENSTYAYTHTVLVSGMTSDGQLRCYAHNDAKNNATLQVSPCGYCGGKITAVYGFHMNGVKAIQSGGSSSSGNTTEAEASTLAISMSDYPKGTLKKGSYYSLQGVVKSNYTINFVQGSIIDSAGKTYCRESVNPGSKSYSLYNSDIDYNMTFNTLPAGTYYVKISAKDESGQTKNWRSDVFKVQDKEEKAASTLAISMSDYPKGTLNKGTYYSLKGTINSNYTINSIQGTVVDSGGKTYCSYSVNPASKSYSLYNSDIDYNMTFNTLPAGTYYVKINAKDESGQTKSWSSGAFKIQVKEEKAVSTLAVSMSDYPKGTLNKGTYYSLKGTINSNYRINSVQGTVVDSGGKTYCSYSVNPGSKSYSLYNSDIDYNMTFNTLPAGTYYLKISAKDESGQTKSWSSGAFKIQAKEEKAASTLAISMSDYPKGTLKKGSYYSLQGVIKSNYTINFVQGSVIDSAGKTYCRKSVNPDSKSYSLYNSDIDYNMTFNTLPAGTYYLKIIARDVNGEEQIWRSGTFTVK